MKKIVALLSVLLVLTACRAATTPQSTTTSVPTVSVPKYTLMGTYKMGGTSAPTYAYYVVVDKELDTNRTALRSIVDALCKTTTDCQVTFWDDISKAGTSPNYTDAQMNAYIAIYNRNSSEEQLAICTLDAC